MALKSKPLEAVRPDVPVHVVGREEIVRVNLLVPTSVRKRWKTAAVASDTTLTELIVAAMEEKLATMKQ